MGVVQLKTNLRLFEAIAGIPFYFAQRSAAPGVPVAGSEAAA